MNISPNDNKNYLAMTLDNGLRVVLVEQEDCHKNACSLVVNTGHFDDPSDRPGFAHFIEHLLFNGSKKYPEVNSLSQFVGQHGGMCNAWTGTEHSCFYFDVHPEFFAPALDQFANMFIDPLFSHDALAREQDAIHEEYKLKLQDDSRRIQQVHKQTSNPEHPFHKFSVGNKHTLSDLPDRPVADELNSFWLQHYQAQFMTVSIVTAEPIEMMRDLIATTFSGIKTTDSTVTKPNIEPPLYRDQELNQFIGIHPVKEIHKLNVTFSMPDMNYMYNTKMLSFVAHIIGYEGRGSLYEALNAKEYINALTAGNGISGDNFKDFNLSLELTELGEDNIDDILAITFAYLNFLKQSTPAAYLYDEQQVLTQVSFNYQEEIKATKLANQIALNMQHYPEVDYLSGDYRMDGFDLQQWQDVLGYLHADNFRVTLVSQSIHTQYKAPWYHTPYSVTDIDLNVRELLNNSQWHEFEFQLPPENPYLGGDIKLEYLDFNSLIPINIEDKLGWKTWFKQDVGFRVPKGNIYLGLDLPIGISNKRNQAMMRMFCDLFLDSVSEQHYQAEMAGLHYNIYAHNGGITLYTSGLSNRQHELLLTLIGTMLKPNFVESRFKEIKRQLIKHWNNSESNRPISLLFSHLNSTLIPKVANSLELAEILADVSFSEFLEFHSTLFTAVNAEMLIYGNWNTQQAININALIEQRFSQSTKVEENKRAHVKIDRIGVEKRRVDVAHSDNAAIIYLQGNKTVDDTTDVVEKAWFILCSQILAPYAFNYLRTEQQLGYLAGSGYMPLCNVPGLVVYVQSHEVQNNELERHIGLCIEGFVDELDHLDLDEFNAHKQAVIHQYQEQPANLNQKCQQLWVSIGNKDYEFNHKARIVEELQLATLDELQQWAKTNLLNQFATGYQFSTE